METSHGSPRVSVLIPTYRDAELIRRSLPTFLAPEPGAIEIVVTNSGGRTSRLVRAFTDDEPTVSWRAGRVVCG